MVNLFDCDIFAVCETFLRGSETLNLSDYTWVGQNRNTNISPNARRGSGGVGVFIKNEFLVNYDLSVDRSLDDVVFVKLTSKQDNTSLTVCVCYLPPEHSWRHMDVDSFFSDLMKKVYEYQNDDHLVICGDFNARIGCESDYIEGVDDVKPREVIDETLNSYGDHLLDFLINCNMCILNGRVGSNDFTHVSRRGRSVVDYVYVPHEKFAQLSDFSVHTMTDIINCFDLHSQKVSDHSVISWTKQLLNSTTGSDTLLPNNAGSPHVPKYVLNDIPPSFLNCEQSFQLLMDTIGKIENNLQQENDVTKAYQIFVDLILSEMEIKLKKKRAVPKAAKQHKSRAKAYWNSELQDMWDKVSFAEQKWLKFKGSTGVRNKLREEYCSVRDQFDKINRRAKRAFQLQEQKSLHDRLYDVENPRDFWTQIGRIGMSNERKTSIPIEVLVDDTVSTDYEHVMRKWKNDYDCLYNSDNSNSDFDNRHLREVTNSIADPNNNVFPKPDCSSLNGPITYDEVYKAVYRAKLRKASGIDNIPSEILRNECCVGLLFKIISFCFEHGCIPSEWAKGVIKPLPKGDDPRNPLNYRPITLIFIPCKIYANILNARLGKFLENGNILTDVQNGFRKDRSCQDHVYSLYSIINNRKLKKRDTFACFVDMKKAFDTVNRDCLWFKLLKAGIHGKILNAIQSLYKDVSCAVSINGDLTEWFPVRQGVKQGCGLSPTLFAIYINDLVNDINELNCGIDVGDTRISSFLYADDIVLLTENAEDMQRMLNVLHVWCGKWRLVVNESKTKVVHFCNRTKSQCDVLFTCGNKSVEYSDCYKYLGFWFNEFLDMEKSINEVTKSASRALGAIYIKYQSAGGMTYSVYTKLIESVVEPVLFYCSGIWGNRKFPKVESVMNKACRYFLGVSKNAPNLSSKGDMGWVSADTKQKLETVRLWCRLRNMPEQRSIRKIHEWSFSVGKSLENRMLKFIESLGIREPMSVPNPSKYVCLKLAREKLIAIEKQSWQNQLASDGNSENGNKLRTYRTYKNRSETESYVTMNLRRDHRRILAKFRGCNLSLAVETGRYTKPKTPHNERICKFCDSVAI